MNTYNIERNTNFLINFLRSKLIYKFENELISEVIRSVRSTRIIDLIEDEIVENEIIEFVKKNVCPKLVKIKDCYMDSNLVLIEHDRFNRRYEFVLKVNFYQNNTTQVFRFAYNKWR